MTRSDPTAAEPEACPYLGLADDPRTRFTFPVQAHRCHAGSRPASIDLALQGAYCLSSRYSTCDRYRAPKAAVNATGDRRLSVAPEAVPSPPPVAPPPVAWPSTPAPPVAPPPVAPPPTAPVAETTLPKAASSFPRKRPWFAPATPVADTRARLPKSAPPAAPPVAPPAVPPEPPAALLTAPESAPLIAPLAAASGAEPAATGEQARPLSTPQRSRRKRSVRRQALLLLIVLVVGVVGVVAVAVATGSLARLLPAGLLPGTVALPSATGGKTPPAVSPSPVASAAPTAVASPSLTPTPTAAPSATAASPITHIVQNGESLTSIAALYGVTPQAITRANHLKDPNLLRVGQKLVIPTAP